MSPLAAQLTSKSKIATPIQISASQNVSKKEQRKIADPKNRFGWKSSGINIGQTSFFRVSRSKEMLVFEW